VNEIMYRVKNHIEAWGAKCWECWSPL